MIIKNPIQIKTLPDEMYLENQVNEFKGNGSDDVAIKILIASENLSQRIFVVNLLR